LKPHDLLATSRLLVSANKHKPTQANLRRAVSTIYYALFHAMARNGADMLIGGEGAVKSSHAWVEVYRSLSHGTAKSACESKAVILRFPIEIVNFSQKFVEMQGKRHDADYDPGTKFYRSDVLNDLDSVDLAIKSFGSVSVKDKRAFASWVLFKNLKRS
jgi:hypothetical protein